MNDPINNNNKNENCTNINQNQPQQLSHKVIFESRHRTHSLGSYPTTTYSKQSNDRVPRTNKEDDWKEVTGKKRPHSSPENVGTQKQTKLDTYWLSQTQPIPTTNSFTQLAEDETQVDNTTTVEKTTKPPPIFVDKVGNVRPLLNMLNEHAPNMYALKVLHNDQVKIQTKSADTYRIIVKQLEQKQTEFFTYKPKQDRAFKAVLKSMHPSTNPDDIKEALNDMDYSCINVWNIKQRTTKKPLPMFIVELLPNDNNKRIYEVKSLMQCIVSFEPPRPKREIPQCAKCQQYGHTKTYCRRQPKCIKCAGDHLSIDCPRKIRSDQVKCILCDGNHPANYKGCKIYRELQNLKFPKAPDRRFRNKNQFDKTESHEQETLTAQKENSQNTTRQTYRDVLTKEHQFPQNSDIRTNDMREIMDLLKQMMQQLTTLTNQIIALTMNLSK